MNEQEFIVAFVAYYFIEKSESASLRLNTLVAGIKRNGWQFEDVFDLITNSFVPTNLNPYPLLAHIVAQVKEKQKEERKDNMTDEKDEAQEIADWVIESVNKCSVYEPQKAKEFIGAIGWQVVQSYGGWVLFASTLMTDEIEMKRAHLRDSAASYLRGARSNLQAKLSDAPSLKQLLR